MLIEFKNMFLKAQMLVFVVLHSGGTGELGENCRPWMGDQYPATSLHWIKSHAAVEANKGFISSLARPSTQAQ